MRWLWVGVTFAGVLGAAACGGGSGPAGTADGGGERDGDSDRQRGADANADAWAPPHNRPRHVVAPAATDDGRAGRAAAGVAVPGAARGAHGHLRHADEPRDRPRGGRADGVVQPGQHEGRLVEGSAGKPKRHLAHRPGDGRHSRPWRGRARRVHRRLARGGDPREPVPVARSRDGHAHTAPARLRLRLWRVPFGRERRHVQARGTTDHRLRPGRDEHAPIRCRREGDRSRGAAIRRHDGGLRGERADRCRARRRSTGTRTSTWSTSRAARRPLWRVR